jgi:peroxiredoxin
MNRLSHWITAISLLLALESSATPATALRIQKSWDLAIETWSAEAKNATTPEARAKVIAKRPNATTFARQMWETIGPSLKQDWTLEPAAWFLVAARGQITEDAKGSRTPTFSVETEAIRKSIESYHLKSPKLIPMCMALASLGDPRSLSILEKIESGHPDKKTQGVAALGAALILKTLGDNADLARKRLTYLRKAIIESSDVQLSNTTVAKLAENELYVISFLDKGRIAPDLSGVDSAGRPLKLSDQQGKVVILLFWGNTIPEAERVVQITADMTKKFQGKAIVILGVNHDPLDQLRALESEGTVTWKNFSDPENKLAAEFRVSSLPTVFVLDGQRKIHYVGTQGTFAELTAEALLSEVKP